MQLRKETLSKYPEWTQPSGDEVCLVIEQVGYPEWMVADLVGVKKGKGAVAGSGKVNNRGSRTVARWKSGESPIPYAAWCLLLDVAGYGQIWK